MTLNHRSLTLIDHYIFASSRIAGVVERFTSNVVIPDDQTMMNMEFPKLSVRVIQIPVVNTVSTGNITFWTGTGPGSVSITYHV